MSNKRKQIFVLILLIAVVMSPMFASEIKNGTTTLNLAFVQRAVNLIVGIFAGGYVLLKAALDIFHAVRNSSEDPNGLKKAIGGLVLNIAILAAFLFVINYVFSGYVGNSIDLSSDTNAAQNGFFGALTGSLVTVRNAVGL